jgi:hypothetical protein
LPQLPDGAHWSYSWPQKLTQQISGGVQVSALQGISCGPPPVPPEPVVLVVMVAVVVVVVVVLAPAPPVPLVVEIELVVLLVPPAPVDVVLVEAPVPVGVVVPPPENTSEVLHAATARAALRVTVARPEMCIEASARSVERLLVHRPRRCARRQVALPGTLPRGPCDRGPKVDAEPARDRLDQP